MLLFGGFVILALLPCIRTDQVSDNISFKLIREELSQFALRFQELETANALLSKENGEFKARFEVLEATVLQQQKELELLKNADAPKDNLPTTDTPYNNSSVPGINLPGANKRAVSQTNQLRRIRQANNGDVVAFFSTLSGHITSPGSNQQVIFDHVITNAGSGYNKYSGDFRVPVAGLYVFSITLRPYSTSYQPSVKFMVNGVVKSSLYSYYGTACEQVIVDLKQDETVTVHTVSAGQRIHGQGYTTFSGFLLQPYYGGIAAVGK